MALGFGFRRPAAALGECCDRCGAPGKVRYAKDGVLVLDDQGAEVKQVDLVACDFHNELNAPVLIRQGFRPVEVAR